MSQSLAKSKVPKLSFRTGFVCLLLVAVTFGIYWPVRHAEFVVYDDDQYVRENPHVNAGLSWPAVQWAFAGGHEANWHPLTWISHMLDCQWFGLDAGKHHLINVFIHAINSLLVFGLLRRLTGAFWRSAMVAALFAWHPMHVESVAWIAERKDVLSTFFWLLTIFAYAAYSNSIASAGGKCQNAQIKTQKSRLLYALTFFLFALSLMSKPMVVTLPFLLLLLDFWPLPRRASWKYLIVEKLPLLALSAICSIITYKVQSNDKALNLVITFGVRLATALIAYVRYVGKLFWPTKLAVFYPYDFTPAAGPAVAASLLLLTLSASAVLYARQKPFIFVGWFWFLGTLVPAIGLVQVGKQSMADRYTYVPAVGLFIALVWLIAELLTNRSRLKPFVIGTTIVILIGCAAVAYAQVGYWHDSKTLFQHTLDVTPTNDVAEYNLAYVLYGEDQYAEAMTHFENSLRLDPEQSTAECNLGLCLAKLGQDREALPHFQNAIKLDDQEWATHLDYALSLSKLGDAANALDQFQAAVRLNPNAYKGHFSLGEFLLGQNRFPEARVELEETVRLDPNESAPHLKLAVALNSLGQTEAAIAEYESALRLSPDSMTALNDLAWIRAASADSSFRNGPEAVRLAQHACELSHYEEPLLIGTLADAYAEAGRFKEAEDAAIKARNLAQSHQLDKIAAKNEELLQLYRNHQAYHESAAVK